MTCIVLPPVCWPLYPQLPVKAVAKREFASQVRNKLSCKNDIIFHYRNGTISEDSIDNTRITINAIAIPRVNLVMLPLLQNLFDALFTATSGQHQFVAAAAALKFDVHTHTQYLPPDTAAGMLFLQFHNIMQL